MNLMLDSLAPYGFNQRIMTEDDFFHICEIEKITVTFIPKKFSFWTSIDGESHIGISDRLKGLKKTFVMFHELAHHFRFSGEDIDQIHFYNANRRKHEFEADALATISIYPLGVLMEGGVLDEQSRFARFVEKERKKLYFLYGR
jgi:hypothetical protein